MEEEILGEEAENSRIDDKDDNGAGDAVAQDDGVELDRPLYLGLCAGDGAFEDTCP